MVFELLPMKTVILLGVSLWLIVLVLWCSLGIIQELRNYKKPYYLIGNEHLLPGNKLSGCYSSSFYDNDFYCIFKNNATVYIYIQGSDIIATTLFFEAIPLGELVVYYNSPKIVQRYGERIMLVWDNLYIMVPRNYTLETPVRIVTYRDMNLGE